MPFRNSRSFISGLSFKALSAKSISKNSLRLARSSMPTLPPKIRSSDISFGFITFNIVLGNCVVLMPKLLFEVSNWWPKDVGIYGSKAPTETLSSCFFFY